MKKLSYVFAMLLISGGALFAQVGINSDGSQPDPSAGLDVKFSNKGFLLPRLSQSQIQAISNPANGLQVFCTTDSKMYIYAATVGQWKEVVYGTGIIIPPFSCGIPITINHMVSGGVAPVDKTVTYGTVTNIPGEPSKCWITSNLGADHQATAVIDVTEASAGWYWQFNRQQGYKHDGTTLTPSWTITSINENSDWIAANDPCTLELGSDWHIPASTEWTNVVASGGWTDWNGPWNSALKMHVAGYLSDSDGSLSGRGSSGLYWSSSQYSSNTNAWFLYFFSGNCYMDYCNKARGITSRCLRD